MSNLNRHPVRRTAAGVLAGALAFSGAFAAATPAFAAPGFQLDRIAGADRYETSALTVRAFDDAATVTNVILASGETGRAADALGASFLAGVRNAPVLLTPQATLSATTRAELTRLRTTGATSVTIVGGPAAVSNAVQAEVTALGFTVNRLGGVDRFQTAELVAAAGEGASASNVGIVASGISTVDALAVGPLAYKGKHPIFLTRAGSISAGTIASMRANGVTSVYIVGGEAVVSANVRTQLTAAGITVVDRLAGQTRSGTSVAIANAIIGGTFGFTNTTFNVASGANDGVDALSGAALSGLQNRALLITDTATNAGAVTAFATARAATLTAPGIIFGGPAAVSPAVETAIETAGGGTGATGTSATTRPELVGASIVRTTTVAQAGTNPAGTLVAYTFDEPVVSVNQALFNVYDASGTRTASSGTNATIRSGNTRIVDVLFPGIATASAAGNLTTATVELGAAADASGQVTPEGDAAIGAGGQSTLTAGTTSAPDLVSVGGFRTTTTAGTVAVDFTFDQAAFVQGTGAFQLVDTDGRVVAATAAPTTGSSGLTNASGQNIAGGNGSTVITVLVPQFTGGGGVATTATAANVARGLVLANTVGSTPPAGQTVNGVAGLACGAAGADCNPLQASNTPDAATGTPDLVSATFTAGTGGGVDTVTYTFDEPVQPGTVDRTRFRAYNSSGDEILEIANGATNPPQVSGSQVAVFFGNGTLANAVGASVDSAAVTAVAGSNAANVADEVGVTNAAATTVTPGRTAGPDLTGVALSSSTVGFVTTYTATYTFDQALTQTGGNTVTAAGVSPQLFLHLADGSRLQCTGATATVGTGLNGLTTSQVSCSSFAFVDVVGGVDQSGTNTGTASAAQIGSAVLGTVNQADATAAGQLRNGSNFTPEGAEPTTGGTGTRTQ